MAFVRISAPDELRLVARAHILAWRKDLERRALAGSTLRRKLSAGDNLKARRDRALLSLLLHHGLRRDELSRLSVNDVHQRRGVPHLCVHGKGSKVRNIPLHPATQGLLAD